MFKKKYFNTLYVFQRPLRVCPLYLRVFILQQNRCNITWK